MDIDKHIKETEDIICKYLPKEEGFCKTVIEAMNYSFLAGGKRIRPMLMLETYRMFSGKDAAIEPFMAGMEMLHTSSLIHDDLPAMDDDKYRRGRLTNHMVFGEAMAILAGDALMLYAFETCAKAYSKRAGDEAIGRAISVFANKAGIYGMVGGQTLDVQMEGKPLTIEQIEYIHHNKTGALIEASMMIGAILAHADDEKVDKIRQIARNIGLAFQIIDDILDVEGDKDIIGKPIGSDEQNNKTTYVTLRGIQGAKEDAKALSNQAIELLDSFEEKNEFLNQLIRLLLNRKR